MPGYSFAWQQRTFVIRFLCPAEKRFKTPREVKFLGALAVESSPSDKFGVIRKITRDGTAYTWCSSKLGEDGENVFTRFLKEEGHTWQRF